MQVHCKKRLCFALHLFLFYFQERTSFLKTLLKFVSQENTISFCPLQCFLRCCCFFKNLL